MKWTPLSPWRPEVYQMNKPTRLRRPPPLLWVNSFQRCSMIFFQGERRSKSYAKIMGVTTTVNDYLSEEEIKKHCIRLVKRYNMYIIRNCSLKEFYFGGGEGGGGGWGRPRKAWPNLQVKFLTPSVHHMIDIFIPINKHKLLKTNF